MVGAPYQDPYAWRVRAGSTPPYASDQLLTAAEANISLLNTSRVPVGWAGHLADLVDVIRENTNLDPRRVIWIYHRGVRVAAGLRDPSVLRDPDAVAEAAALFVTACDKTCEACGASGARLRVGGRTEGPIYMRLCRIHANAAGTYRHPLRLLEVPQLVDWRKELLRLRPEPTRRVIAAQRRLQAAGLWLDAWPHGWARLIERVVDESNKLGYDVRTDHGPDNLTLFVDWTVVWLSAPARGAAAFEQLGNLISAYTAAHCAACGRAGERVEGGPSEHAPSTLCQDHVIASSFEWWEK